MCLKKLNQRNLFIVFLVKKNNKKVALQLWLILKLFEKEKNEVNMCIYYMQKYILKSIYISILPLFAGVRVRRLPRMPQI